MLDWIGENFLALTQAATAVVIAFATLRYVRLSHELLRVQADQMRHARLDRNAPLLEPIETAIKSIQTARARLGGSVQPGDVLTLQLLTPEFRTAIHLGKANPHPWVRRKLRSIEKMLERAESLTSEVDEIFRQGIQHASSPADLGDKLSSLKGILAEVEGDLSNLVKVLVGELER